MKEFNVTCKYCGHKQKWTFVPDVDYPTMEKVIEYDYEEICDDCGGMFRINEGLDEADLKEYE